MAPSTGRHRAAPFFCVLLAYPLVPGADAYHAADAGKMEYSFEDNSNFMAIHRGSGRSHELHLDRIMQKQEQNPGGSGTETTHKSWFERMGEAVLGVFVALFFLIPFSIALLWVNERRNAQLESLITLGQSEAETVEASEGDAADYDGTLVHMNSEDAKGLEPVRDARFPDVKMESGCLRLRSIVEVYHWEESVSEEKKKDSLGGGETTVKKYSYSRKWSSAAIDSSEFNQSFHQNTVHVQGLQFGTREEVNAMVKYGKQHRLSEDMVQMLNNFESASKLIGSELKPCGKGATTSYTFQAGGDDWYLCPLRSSEPEIGDCRVKVEYVTDGPATILALQMKDNHNGGDHTFGPYRSVPRGCCGSLPDSELKKLHVAAAKKDADELYEEERCGGPFSCLCACCNFVTWIFSHVQSPMFSLVPQIYSAWPGHMSKKQCFDSEATSGTLAKWGLRVLGWLLLWTGFCMLFKPLEVLLDVIPFLGPYLGSGASWALGALSFILTLVIATLIVSCAYLVYHPLVGLLYMALTAGIVVAITYLGMMLDAKNK